MNEIQVQVADWATTNSLRLIRHEVFIKEQDVPPELEWDEQDEQCTHFLMAENGCPIGTARLLTDGHIGRVAILAPWRGQGLGARLMHSVMDHARANGHMRLALSAQVQAIGFYSRQGFAIESDEYLEAGIPHRDMVWISRDQEHLPPIEFVSPGRFEVVNPEIATPPRYTGTQSFVLGQEAAPLEINEGNALATACEMILQVRRTLTISGAELASWLFNRRDFIDCCEQLIAARPKCRIRILLQDVPKELLFGHSLVNLMHRFPSFCEIRKQHPELTRTGHVFLLADAEGILMLPRATVREGFARYRSPDQVRRWTSHFNKLWESSQSDSALRRFLL